MRSAYSPMIQIMHAFASVLSRVSRFSQRVPMMCSYLFGYLRRMSRITIIASVACPTLHTHTPTHKPTHAHTRARTRTQTHTHTHTTQTHTHTHTHMIRQIVSSDGWGVGCEQSERDRQSKRYAAGSSVPPSLPQSVRKRAHKCHKGARWSCWTYSLVA